MMPRLGDFFLADRTGDRHEPKTSEGASGDEPPANALPPWTPFERGYYPEPAEEDIQRRMALWGDSREKVLEAFARQQRQEVFVNSRYQVVRIKVPATEHCEELIRLSIRRHDWEPVGPERYRDFMRIRDELVGFEHDAVELYPPRSVEIDGANTYHLWVYASAQSHFPFGWRDGRGVLREAKPGTKQRPFDPDDYVLLTAVDEAADS